MKKKVYILENLGCANCASRIEQKIAALPGVEEATITFATRQLRLTAEDPDSLIPEIQKIANALEPEIVITERTRRAARDTGHGHDHAHEEHEHHHLEHGDSCPCGHDHAHEEHEHHLHEHGDSCSCGHDHAHEEHEHHHHGQKPSPDGTVTRTYLVENLGCANCAARMERRINELPSVASATLTFATKQLKVTGKDPDALLADMQQICASIESEVRLVPKNSRPGSENIRKQSERKTPSPAPEARTAKRRPLLTDNQQTLLGIGIGAVLLIVGKVLEYRNLETASLLVLVASYVLLGWRVVLTAVKNLAHGQVFDENFLMSVATLGAFLIREYPEAAGVMLFYRIGEFFEHIAVEKSRSQIMNAVDMRPEVVNLVTGDEVRVIDAEEANAGDILLIRPGDRIPLDGVIIEGESRIDTSPVTGEPVPVKAVCGDEVTSGCVNTSGLLKIRVEKVLEESMVTRILDSVENAAASKPKIDRFITRFARIYTPVVVLLAACTAILPSLFTGNWDYWVYTALSFLVMSCPCALVLSVPLAFFSGIGAGSKRGILFKGGVSLEAMTNVDAVVMDKTGTITKGNFVVQRSVPSGKRSADELLALCASCELTSTHPIGNSIVTAARERNLEIIRPETVEEIAGHGIRAILPGGEILCGNRKLMEKYHISLNDYQKEAFGTEVLAAENGVFIGYLVISDTIKEDAQTAIAQIKKLGISTVMLTGDAQDSAEAVAAASGIEEVHARLLPQDKLSELQKIRAAKGAVMFVGDGINDAPVLAGADVGAAMGSGADAAIEAADVVFMTSSMEAIPQALAIARATSRISWQNVVFALAVKICVMILGLCGFASMWMAVFADTGVAMLCILNSIRVLYKKNI
ncbi:MAG: heavy metal translocating P-type ATPase [Candidatus Limivivens sp.]|nr:heavy metal translocating P-type ATPase [Candidatus Limivivens sp.]